MNREVAIAMRAMADEIKARGLLVPRGVELATAASGWARYTGPRGGHGWRSISTGRILYQADEPGAGQHKGENQPEHVAVELPAAVPPAAPDHAPYHAILTGDLGYVDGFPVRRPADDTWRLETPTGHVTGGPDDVQAHIDELKRHEANAKPMLDAALARAAAYDEPNFFTNPDRVHADARAFEALPAGALVVSLFDDTRGRLGRVVPTAEGNRVKLHGVEGWASNDVEPLDANHSWRAGRAPAAPPPPRLRQGMLFSTDGRAWVHLETSVGDWTEHDSILERARFEPDSPVASDDAIAAYMAGDWLPVESSNVAAIRYLPEDGALEVEYHGGKGHSQYYRYEDISPEEAEEFATAPSKGVWCWDHLRERGSATGHQKSYSFISSISSYQPKWMLSVGPHGRIGVLTAGGVRYPGSGLRLATAHAPAGGITIAGKRFEGGQFITDKHLAKATDAQKATLEYRPDLFDAHEDKQTAAPEAEVATPPPAPVAATPPPAKSAWETSRLTDALEQARQADKMFKGEGRYEAEVYKKMNGEAFPNVKLTAEGQAYYDDIKDPPKEAKMPPLPATTPLPAATSPGPLEPWQMTAAEAAAAGLPYGEWSNAVSRAFVDEKINDDHPAYQSIRTTGIDDYLIAKELIGEHVATANGHLGKAVGVSPDASVLTVRHADGTESKHHTSGVGHLAADIGHDIKDGKPVSPRKLEYFAPVLAQQAIDQGKNISEVMREHHIDPIKGKQLRAAIVEHLDKIKAAAAEKEPWQLPQKDFKGAKAVHRIQVEKAWRDGKDVPAEVLADYPDLQPTAKVVESPTEPSAGTVNPFRKEADELRAKADRLSGNTAHDEAMAEAFPFGTGRPGNASSRRTSQQSDKRIESTIDRAVKATKLYKQANALEAKAAAFDAGRIDHKGNATESALQEQADKKQKLTDLNSQIADYMRGTLKPGDTVYVNGNAVKVDRVNPKTVTTEGGAKWSYDELLPHGDGGPMTAKQLVTAARAWEKPSEAAAPASHRIETRNTALGWVGYVVDPSRGSSGLVATARDDEGMGYPTEEEAVAAAKALVPKPVAPTAESLSDEQIFARSGEGLENLQKALGFKKPVMGPAGAERVRNALAKHAGGKVIAELLKVDGGETSYDRNGFADRGGDVYRAALEGKYTKAELQAAADWLEDKFNNSRELANVNQHRWIRGSVLTAKPSDSSELLSGGAAIAPAAPTGPRSAADHMSDARKAAQDEMAGKTADQIRPGDLEVRTRQIAAQNALKNAKELSEDDFVSLMKGEGRKDMAKGNAVSLLQQAAGVGPKKAKEMAEEIFSGIDPTREGAAHFAPTVARTAYDKPTSGVTKSFDYLPAEQVYRAVHQAATKSAVSSAVPESPAPRNEPEPAQEIKDQKATEQAVVAATKKRPLVEDFGEKIGGARKETARSPGARAKKAAADARPAWARRYTVTQVVGSTKPGEEGKWAIHDTKDTDWFGKPKQKGQLFGSKEEAEGALPLLAVARNHRVRVESGTQAGGDLKFGIYRNVTDNKRALVKGGFATEAEAMAHMAAQPEAIIDHKFPRYENYAYLDDVQRHGPARKTKDVTPEDFQKAFQFRGGQFGNWQSGRDGVESLNHAYDALHDLTDAVGLPTKAAALNGDLAIAFGARGTGGENAARAHYEPEERVMNLTKMAGAGSLAHEWAHALDHAIGKIGNHNGNGVSTSHYKVKLRPELESAAKRVRDTIASKEIVKARDEEREGKASDNARKAIETHISDLEERLKGSSYRPAKPFTPEQQAQWDAAKAKLLSGDVGGAKFIPTKSGGQFSGRDTFEPLEEMNVLYKKATGHSFHTADDNSKGKMLYWAVQRHVGANQRVAEAKAGLSETKMGKSDFYNEAVKLDSTRAGDYYTEPHEMFARAFEAYVADKLHEKGIRSDYLVNHGKTDNRTYAMFGMKPFPEGDERVAINAAFDQFFKELKHQERDDEKGSHVQFLSTAPPQSLRQQLEAMGGRWDGGKWRMPNDKVAAAKELVRSRKMHLATAHAPTGGISIGGTKFAGGQFIPGHVLAKATDEQKAKLVRKESAPARDEAHATKELAALISDTKKADAAYDALPDAEGGKIINADTARELLPEFRDDYASRVRFSETTASLGGAYAYDRLNREIENRGDRQRLMILAGGPAAGKSSSLGKDTLKDADLVWDTTLREHAKAEKVIDRALANGWQVYVRYVHTDPENWVRGLLDRTERTGRWGKFASTPKVHRDSQRTVERIMEKYGDKVPVDLFHNTWGADGAKQIEPADIRAGGKHHFGEDADARAAKVFSALQDKYDPNLIKLVKGEADAADVASEIAA